MNPWHCDPPAARLADFNRVAGSGLPRCLMIVDEAQSLFEDREIRPHAKRLLKDVAGTGPPSGCTSPSARSPAKMQQPLAVAIVAGLLIQMPLVLLFTSTLYAWMTR